MNQKDKLKPFITPDSSKWMNQAAERAGQEGMRSKAQKIALNIQDILNEKHMSQAELAKQVGVSRQQIGKILKGQENLTLETIDKLERALEMKLIEVDLFIPKIANSVSIRIIDEASTRMMNFHAGIFSACRHSPKTHFNQISFLINSKIGNPRQAPISITNASLMRGIELSHNLEFLYLKDNMATSVIPAEGDTQSALV